jgi:glutamine amidotransferase
MMIAVVDYGMGNLRSVVKGFEKVGVTAAVTADPAVVRAADAVVLPGVGAFGMAMAHLRDAGLDTAIVDAVHSGKPFLGICLGLQLLFAESEEFGPVAGLGILPGRVVRFFPVGAPDGVKIPHMGWNALHYAAPTPVFDGVPEGTHVYFVHSYYVVPDDPSVIAATSELGGFRFTAAVTRGNLFACQFHPEKSSTLGLRMLNNFAARVAETV